MNNAAIERSSTGGGYGVARRAIPVARATPRRDIRETTEQSTRLMLHGRSSPWRAQIEALIEREYRRIFGADVREFMPAFVALHDSNDEVIAAVGCRSAASEPLFLENYTDKPVEAMIAERADIEISRDAIVEIGSLVCRDARAAMVMIRALIPFLIEAGFEWVAFTGSAKVVRILRALNLLPLALCAAERSKLGVAGLAWGRYYDSHPVVMAGRLRNGFAFLQESDQAR